MARASASDACLYSSRSALAAAFADVSRRRLSGWRAERELALVKPEVPGGVAVDVGQGHVTGEERVPGDGVVHAAAQRGSGFPSQPVLEGRDDMVEHRGHAPRADDPGAGA